MSSRRSIRMDACTISPIQRPQHRRPSVSEDPSRAGVALRGWLVPLRQQPELLQTVKERAPRDFEQRRGAAEICGSRLERYG